MKDDELIFPSGAERSERASEAAAEPSVSEATRARELSRLAAKAQALRAELQRLPHVGLSPLMLAKRRLKLGAQLNRVELKLYRLKQRRLC